MELKEFEEKAKKYFKEIATDESLWDIVCDGCDCEDCCFNDCDLETIKRRNFSYLYTDKNVAKLEKYLEDKKMGNFKVRCVDNNYCDGLYTVGKIYEAIDGIIQFDNKTSHNIDSFNILCQCTTATWELVEDTDTNEYCVECQPNHKSCNTCYFYEEEESAYPCNTCVSGSGDNEMYERGEGCHICGRTFEIEDAITEKTLEDKEQEILQLHEKIDMQKMEIEDLKTEKEKHTALFAKLYQEKEEQDKILKEKNNLIASYRDDIAELKLQLPKEKTIDEIIDEKELELIETSNKKTLREAHYKDGYLKGLDDMRVEIEQVLMEKGIK